MNSTSMSAALVPDVRDRLTALLLFFLFASLYGGLSLGYVESVDAVMDYQTARGFLVHRDGAIHDDTAEGRRILEESFAGTRGLSGKFYSWHGPGRPLVGVGFLAAGDQLARIYPRIVAQDHAWRRAEDGGETPGDYFQRLCFTLSSALAAAGVVALLYLMARVLGTTRATAFSLACIAALGTYLGPAARSALNACQATFLIAFAWYLWLRHGRGRHGAREIGWFGLFAAGVLAGLAVWTRPTATFVVFVLSCYGLWVLVRRRAERSLWKDGIAFAVGILGVAALILAWNQHRFGDWKEFGHGEAISGEQFAHFEPRFLVLNYVGEWFSPGRGLLWFAPILLLLPFALRRDRETRPERVALLFAVLCGTLWPIFSSSWHGGPFYGPRYLLPVLPLALAALAPWIGRAMTRPFAKHVVHGLFAIGFCIQVPGFLVSYMTVHEVSIAAAKDELLVPAKEFVRAQVEPLVMPEQLDRAAPLFASSTRAELEARIEEITVLDPGAGAFLQEQVKAWDREHQYLWHLWAPRYVPPLVATRILWSRLTSPSPADEESFDLARWFGVPTADGAFRPTIWEARGWRHAWPLAFDERFGKQMATWIFLGLEVAVVLGLVLVLAVSRDRWCSSGRGVSGSPRRVLS